MSPAPLSYCGFSGSAGVCGNKAEKSSGMNGLLIETHEPVADCRKAPVLGRPEIADRQPPRGSSRGSRVPGSLIAQGTQKNTPPKLGMSRRINDISQKRGLDPKLECPLQSTKRGLHRGSQRRRFWCGNARNSSSSRSGICSRENGELNSWDILGGNPALAALCRQA